MALRVTKTSPLELFALSSVAAPFVGFGVTEATGWRVPFIVGVGIFCAWMCLTSTVLFDAYAQAATDAEMPETADGFDPAGSD